MTAYSSPSVSIRSRFPTLLAEGIQEIPSSVNENMLASIKENCRRRVQACLHAQGRNFEHPLWCLVGYAPWIFLFVGFVFVYNL